MRNPRLEELLESLDVLLMELRGMGCEFVMVLVEPNDKRGFHSWRGGFPPTLYGMLQIMQDEIYEEMRQSIKGDENDTE